MKRTFLYIISALILGFASCQKSGNETGIAPNGQMSFNITTVSTRVANDIFEERDKIGIYVTDYINSTPAPLQVSGNRANNEGMTCNGIIWETERPIYWGEDKSDVYAYYPYMDIVDIDEQPFSVATDQNVEGAYEASDFLWAKAEGVAETDGAVQLEMKHAMSRLIVKIMAGEDYKGSLPKDAIVHLHSTVTDTKVSLATGSVTKDQYAGAKSIKMRNLGIHTFAEGQAVVYEAIVVPQMLLGKVPLLEINSKSVSYLLEDSFNFLPYTSYTYTVVLNTSTTSIKIDIGCDIDDWNNIGGDNGGNEGSSEDDVDLSNYIDLSADGIANCYMVQGAGNYKFKAVQGNLDWTVGNVKKVDVLWETFGTDVMPNVGDLIASTGYQNGYIYFSTAENFNNGNASIAARNSKGLILWSWHIWCTEEGWSDQVYANNAGTMMDRNLGATSATPGDVSSLGLLYQWSRKDPFLSGSSITSTTPAASTGVWNTISGIQTRDYAETHPTTFIKGLTWSSPCVWWSLTHKTQYDPCPAGYRVPINSNNWTNSKTKYTIDSTNKGMHWTIADDTTAWYPTAGCIDRSSGSLISNGSNGYYWSTTPYANVANYVYHLYFTTSGSVNTASYSTCDVGDACSVRCIKE